jgi:hypothetical protein
MGTGGVSFPEFVETLEMIYRFCLALDSKPALDNALKPLQSFQTIMLSLESSDIAIQAKGAYDFRLGAPWDLKALAAAAWSEAMACLDNSFNLYPHHSYAKAGLARLQVPMDPNLHPCQDMVELLTYLIYIYEDKEAEAAAMGTGGLGDGEEEAAAGGVLGGEDPEAEAAAMGTGGLGDGEEEAAAGGVLGGEDPEAEAAAMGTGGLGDGEEEAAGGVGGKDPEAAGTPGEEQTRTRNECFNPFPSE